MKYGNIKINNSDSKNEILEKINFNFGQVVSFSSGPEGRQGPVGPTGYPGAAGKKGLIGGTGERATAWIFSETQPDPAQYVAFDKWVSLSDSTQGQIYFNYSGSWQNTGLSVFSDDIFSIKSSLPTLGGTSDYSGIYIRDGITSKNIRTFVISDSDVSATNANPNYSKVLISTNNSAETPILSFRNSRSSGKQPSFYWYNGSTSGALASNTRLKLESDYNVSFKSGATANISIDSATGATGSYFNVTAANITISTYGSDLFLNSGNYAEPPTTDQNVLSLSGKYLNINTSDIFLDADNFESGRNFKSPYGDWVIIQPDGAIAQPEGAIISRGGTSTFPVLWAGVYLADDGVHSFSNTTKMREIFTVRQKPVSISDSATDTRYEGVRGYIQIGSTGGAYGVSIPATGPAGPTGPWAYHVSGNSFATGPYSSDSGPTGASIYYIDATSPILWKDQNIVLSANANWPGGSSIWIKIPGTNTDAVPPLATFYPFWDETHCTEHRIIIDFSRFSKSGINTRIAGIFWDQLYGNTSLPQVKKTYQQFLDVNTGSKATKYIEITYFYSQRDKNVKAVVSTSNGEAYSLKISDYIGS